MDTTLKKVGTDSDHIQLQYTVTELLRAVVHPSNINASSVILWVKAIAKGS